MNEVKPMDGKTRSVEEALSEASARAGAYGDHLETEDLVEALEARGWVFRG